MLSIFTCVIDGHRPHYEIFTTSFALTTTGAAFSRPIRLLARYCRVARGPRLGRIDGDEQVLHRVASSVAPSSPGACGPRRMRPAARPMTRSPPAALDSPRSHRGPSQMPDDSSCRASITMTSADLAGRAAPSPGRPSPLPQVRRSSPAPVAAPPPAPQPPGPLPAPDLTPIVTVRPHVALPRPAATVARRHRVAHSASHPRPGRTYFTDSVSV